MTVRTALCALVMMFAVAGCGGGNGSMSMAPQAPQRALPATQELRFGPSLINPGITKNARDDYYESMDRHFAEGPFADHPRHYGGWFREWKRRPTVVLPRSANAFQKAVVKRAVDVINRSLLPQHRMRFATTANWFSTVSLGSGSRPALSSAWRRTATGNIHVQFGTRGEAKAAGWAYTDGRKGLIDINSSVVTALDPESAVQTVVHELLHAYGFMSHPHDMHQSILSYRYNRDGIVDALPLIDTAMLWDMYGWGDWTGLIVENFEVEGGVQFGAAVIHLETDDTVVGAFVDGGRLGPPVSAVLSGSASYDGRLVGFDAGGNLQGRARLTANFTTSTGTARFDRFANWNGKTSVWTSSIRHGAGYRYTLDYDRHWFRSTDSDPDVVGALYGAGGGMAAGTLERGGTNWIVAGFGAGKN